jgi:hypothetical protein
MFHKHKLLILGVLQLIFMSIPAGLFILYSSFHTELNNIYELLPILMAALLSIVQVSVANYSKPNILKVEWLKNGDNQIYLFLVFMSYFIAAFTLLNCLDQCSLKTTVNNYQFIVIRQYKVNYRQRRVLHDNFSYCTDLDSPVFGSLIICDKNPGQGFLYHEAHIGDVATVSIQEGRFHSYFALGLILNKNGFKFDL